MNDTKPLMFDAVARELALTQRETLETAQPNTLETAFAHSILNTKWPREEFEAYVRAMPQGEAQTALIFLVNYLADLGARGRLLAAERATTAATSYRSQGT